MITENTTNRLKKVMESGFDYMRFGTALEKELGLDGNPNSNLTSWHILTILTADESKIIAALEAIGF
jgi:hypothetical protein